MRLIRGHSAALIVGLALLCAPVFPVSAVAKSTLAEAAWQAYLQGDFAAAVNGFKHLANVGVVKAQTNLGYMYSVGKGVNQDPVEAARWFRMAAEHGHVGAQVTVGLFYWNGEGVEQNVVAAYAWFALAAAGGHETATDYQALAADEMTPAELGSAHDLAKKLYAEYGRKTSLW